MRQEKAIAALEEHGLGNAVDCEPALTGNESVALDAFMTGELDGELTAHVEATGDVAARFQEG
jgi:hypothetical protein